MSNTTEKQVIDYHRGRLIIKTKSGLEFDSDDLLGRWGGGEYKLKSFDYDLALLNDCTIYIPYATFNTVEQAIVLEDFLRKNNITIHRTLIGYVSYSRQDRETETEPRLDNYLITLIASLVNPIVIDIHNSKSLELFNITEASYAFNFYKLAKAIDPRAVIVAPDKGAKARLESYGIPVDIYLNKERTYRRVEVTLPKECEEILTNQCVEDMASRKKRTYFIIDDICDGGRTFIEAAKCFGGRIYGSEISLMVTHALLPYGTAELEREFDKLYTINTAQPHFATNDFITVVDNSIPSICVK